MHSDLTLQSSSKKKRIVSLIESIEKDLKELKELVESTGTEERKKKPTLTSFEKAKAWYHRTYGK